MTNEDRERRWKQLMLRMRDEANHTLSNNRQRGCAIISAHILMDSEGTPLVWVVPGGKRIEPTKDAASIIQELAEGF